MYFPIKDLIYFNINNLHTTLFLIIIILLIPLLIFIINVFKSKQEITNYEKISPFECGFDPISHERLSFNIHF